jgi:hypothetical protein
MWTFRNDSPWWLLESVEQLTEQASIAVLAIEVVPHRRWSLWWD